MTTAFDRSDAAIPGYLGGTECRESWNGVSSDWAQTLSVGVVACSQTDWTVCAAGSARRPHEGVQVQRFADRVAVITGGSRGIGFAIAQRLVDEGASVVITGRRQDSLDEALTALGPQASAVAGKADDPDHRAAVFAHVAERHGRLDHLVNNAGINPAYGPLLEIDIAAAQ